MLFPKCPVVALLYEQEPNTSEQIYSIGKVEESEFEERSQDKPEEEDEEEEEEEDEDDDDTDNGDAKWKKGMEVCDLNSSLP